MDGGTPLCVVCGADLPQPSKRRILYPSGVANEDAGRFFLKFVVNVPRGEIYQDGSRPQYTCKPCFAKLERGSRQYSTTVSLISELRIAVRAAGRPIAVSVSEPFSPVARDSRGTQTDSGKPQEARKRPREGYDVDSTPKRPRLASDGGGRQQGLQQQHDSMGVREREIVVPRSPLLTGTSTTSPGQRHQLPTPSSVLKVSIWLYLDHYSTSNLLSMIVLF